MQALPGLLLRAAFLLVVLLAAAADAAERSDLTESGWPRVIGADRYGPYRIGASEEALLKGRLIVLPADLVEVDDQDTCYYPELPKPAGVKAGAGASGGEPTFIIFKDRLARIEVRDAAVATSDGLRLGDPVSRLLALYGKDPDFRQRNADILKLPVGELGSIPFVVRPRRDGPHGIAYWVSNTAISQIMVGDVETLVWDEGCGTQPPVRRRHGLRPQQ